MWFVGAQFNARLRTDFLQKEKFPFHSATGLALLVRRGELRVADNFGFGAGSWIKRIMLPHTSAQRAMKDALRTHPVIRTYSLDESLSLMAADPSVVFPKRSYLNPFPFSSHYVQLDADAAQTWSHYMVRSDFHCLPGCLSRRAMQRFVEELSIAEMQIFPLIGRIASREFGKSGRSSGSDDAGSGHNWAPVSLPILSLVFRALMLGWLTGAVSCTAAAAYQAVARSGSFYL